jgi:DNA-directed RNA polymerase subunit E'/Rpb7
MTTTMTTTTNNDSLFSLLQMRTRICLNPSELNATYSETVLAKARRQYDKTCLKNIGYVDRVLRILHIDHHEIMKIIPDVIFLITIEVRAYIPKPGDSVGMQVNFIFNHGIFGVFEKIKILVPIQLCEKEWEQKQEGVGSNSVLYMVHKEDPTRQIRMKQVLPVELEKIRFEKDNYSCLAKII